MSQISCSRVPLWRWLWVNGAFASCVLYATIGESRPCFMVVCFLTGLYLLLMLLVSCVAGVEALKKTFPVPPLGLLVELTYDGTMLVLLCRYSPWYVWLMYLTASSLSISLLTRIRAAQVESDS